MQLQDGLLKALCDGKVMVSIYLTNGIRLSGRINTYDRYCIVLENDTHTASQVVYKHAISTISPQHATPHATPPQHAVDDKPPHHS
ncbi:RNA chaperone Hfq [Beggiatoa leptomitoformis]|uniref:RNA chaperone Hfq n=1 Tax=Beggiatoa leptomitoformis TaxID=288004 RepID=A0A2N9YJ40_9GAMM|nr:RNA chaperone Hfq [Beggiatoa leptomitoformis]ALG69260.1 RNA chaperone Hfq [Beggiatoa leptomitoformis]AUI70538.1 RNA chaperone Hfq [Beggiatoa leptomitoformis]